MQGRGVVARTPSFPSSSLGMPLSSKLCFAGGCIRGGGFEAGASPTLAFPSWSLGTRKIPARIGRIAPATADQRSRLQLRNHSTNFGSPTLSGVVGL